MDTTEISPKISIVMPSFNNAEYLLQAVHSVQSQTFTDWELLVINDASTDNTAELLSIAAGQDDRIKVVNHVANQGLTASLNEGINLSQGDYIARLDSDDWWTDNTKLEQQFNFLEKNTDHALVGTNGQAVDGQGKLLWTLNYPSQDVEIRKEILRHNCFIHSSVVLRKNVMVEMGGYENSQKFVEDYELWLKIGVKYKFAVLDINAVSYRVNPQGLTQTRGIEQYKASFNVVKLYRAKYPGYYGVYLKYFFQNMIIRIFGPNLLNKLKRK